MLILSLLGSFKAPYFIPQFAHLEKVEKIEYNDRRRRRSDGDNGHRSNLQNRLSCLPNKTVIAHHKRLLFLIDFESSVNYYLLCVCQ